MLSSCKCLWYIKKSKEVIISWVQNSSDSGSRCQSTGCEQGVKLAIKSAFDLHELCTGLSCGACVTFKLVISCAKQNKLGLKEGGWISQRVKCLQRLVQQCATLELSVAFYFQVILSSTEHSSVVTQGRANLTQNGCQLPLGTIGAKPQAAIRW